MTTTEKATIAVASPSVIQISASLDSGYNQGQHVLTPELGLVVFLEFLGGLFSAFKRGEGGFLAADSLFFRVRGVCFRRLAAD